MPDDYVFVSALSLHKGNHYIDVRDRGAIWDMNYQGFWLHKKLFERVLVDLALRGIEYTRIPVPEEYKLERKYVFKL